MDVAAITRLVAADPRLVNGLIEERAAATLAEAGPEGWAQDHARWRGVCDALEAAAEGSRPQQPLDRPPRWLHGAVRAHLEWCATTSGRDVLAVRVLERLGLVSPEHDDTYVLAFVGGLVGDPRFATTRRSDVLRADPALRQEIIWRVFEVEGAGEVSLANVDRFTPEPRRWSTTFHELVADGTVSRDDVLTAALGALARDFSAYRAGWYSRLYRSFEPTVAESAARQTTLRQLCRSEITATVTMSLRYLVDLARAGHLDDDETVPVLGSALHHDNKTTAYAALTIAEGIAQRRPDLARVLAEQLSAGLAHPHPQVQERTARLLRTLGADDRLEEQAAHLSPAVAFTLGLDRPEGAGVRTPGDPVLPTDAAPGRVIRPAEGPELVELMAALLEDAADPIAIERVLAGLARSGPTDVLVPLAGRASTVLARGPRELVTSGWLRGRLAWLVLASARRPLPPLPWAGADGRDVAPRHTSLRFLGHRIEEIGDIVTGVAPPCTLVATPERTAGGVSAGALVSRVLGGSTMTHDLVAGLLRLVPDERALALDTLDRHAGSAAVPRTVVHVVRHALGAPAPRRRLPLLGRLDEPTQAWWTAAARARDPLGTDPWVARLGLGGTGRAEPLDLRLGVPRPWVPTAVIRDEYVPWVVVGSPVHEPREGQPTAVVDRDRDLASWSEAEDFVPWVATVFPADAEHVSWVAGLDVVDRSCASAEVRHDAVRVLDVLRSHDGRIGHLTLAVLAAGLGAGGVDERVRAVDAVARLAGTGQVEAPGLAEGILAVGPLTPLARLAGSLRDLAAINPALSRLVVDALVGALPHVPVSTRGVHELLAVLLDEFLRAGRPTPPALSPWLAQLRGTSRAATLAATLASRV